MLFWKPRLQGASLALMVALWVLACSSLDATTPPTRTGGCSGDCKLIQKTGYTVGKKRGFKGMLLFARDGYLRQFAALERWLGGKRRKKRR